MIPTIVFGGKEYSADWMKAEIGRAIRTLESLQCVKGSTVAAMLRNGPEYVALILACRMAGYYLASINWHFKALEVAHILNDSGACVLFVHEDFLPQVQDGVPDLVHVVKVSPLQVGLPEPLSDTALGSPPQSAPLVHGFVTYTSGTTGSPKGVRRLPYPEAQRAELEQQLQAVTSIVYGEGTGITALLSGPIYHSAAMGYVSHLSRLAATLVLEPRFDAKRTLELIEQHRVTHAYLVPTMYQRLLALPPEVRSRYDISSLRHVASTGSPCPVDVKQKMIDWFGPIITEAYGSSEAGYTTFINSSDWARHPGSAGKALLHARVRIYDDAGTPLPPEVIGLIYVRQDAATDFTYINRPEARQAIERDGLITLGDMGYLTTDGFLYICDRKADMVISGGVNIYPAEIESVLQTMPAVLDCAVFGIPDAEFGESVAAAVQLNAGHSPDAEAVQSFLRERIANYKVPRLVEFHESLPREDSGKIFKRLLREPHWKRVERTI